jgi:predicted glycosyltransferase
MGGGGADAFALASAFLTALPDAQRAINFRAVVLTGPHMPPVQRSVLTTQANGHKVLVHGTSDDVTSLLHTASAVISMAGYNSLCELLDAQCKALIVPRRGPSAEQRIRSQIFSERRLIRSVDPDTLTPERLTEELVHLLSNGDEIPDRASVPPLDGARRAATVFVHGVDQAVETYSSLLPGKRRSPLPT